MPKHQDYPTWIDEFAQAYHQAYTNMVPCSWGPTDGFTVLRALNGAIFPKLSEAIRRITAKGYSPKEAAQTFPTLSTLRWLLYWLACLYLYTEKKDKQEFKTIIEYFLAILKARAKEDIFGRKSNIQHTPAEIQILLNQIDWQLGSPAAARTLGQLFNSVTSLGLAYYRDFFHEDANEIYGPYSAEKRFGPGTILTIKDHPQLRPTDLWPETASMPYRHVQILQIFRDVAFSCEIIGIHSLYKGDIINGLVAYAVIIDGKPCNDVSQLKELSDYFGQAATDFFIQSERLTNKEWANKTLEWILISYKDFFALADMDWRPTPEMIEIIRNTDIPSRFRLESFPDYEIYSTDPRYEIYWLKDLYI